MRPLRRSKKEYLRSLRRRYYSFEDLNQRYQFIGLYTSYSLMEDLLNVKQKNPVVQIEMEEGSTFEDSDGKWCNLKMNRGFIIPTNASLAKLHDKYPERTIFDILAKSDIREEAVAKHKKAFNGLEKSMAAGLDLSKYPDKEVTISFEAQMTEEEETMDTRSWELVGEFSEHYASDAIDTKGNFIVSLELRIYYKIILYKGLEGTRTLAYDIPNFALPAVVKRMADWFYYAERVINVNKKK